MSCPARHHNYSTIKGAHSPDEHVKIDSVRKLQGCLLETSDRI